MRLHQNAGDLRGDVVPQVDHVAGVEFLAEAVGPEILIVRCPKQRNVDLDLAPHPVDAALQHIVYVRARNGVAQSRLRSETETGVGIEDEDVLEADQRADHFLGDTPGKDVLCRVAAAILKRQNHERRTCSAIVRPSSEIRVLRKRVAPHRAMINTTDRDRMPAKKRGASEET